jgi:hypothetical protein
MESNPAIEFSRIVPFDQIGLTQATYHVEAKDEECRLLAKRFGLVAIHRLNAHFTLSHAEEPRTYRVEGEVIGDVIQSCVSTLKDVPAHVRATFHILLRPSQGKDNEEEFIIDLDDERDIEYYADEVIDLGETAAQYLYLNLDPFPHAPDAPVFPEDPSKKQLNPFASALKGLKKEE